MSETEEQSDNHVIKLRGLPWNVSAQDILDFLEDVEVAQGEAGVHLITSPRDGRPNGEAFVELSSENDYNKAFDYHKKTMGHRYIESMLIYSWARIILFVKSIFFQPNRLFLVFGAKLAEFQYIMRKQNIVQHDTFVKLRGLPYSVTRDDIEQFFEGKLQWYDFKLIH